METCQSQSMLCRKTHVSDFIQTYIQFLVAYLQKSCGLTACFTVAILNLILYQSVFNSSLITSPMKTL